MKQEVGALPVSSTLSSDDERDSPAYIQEGHKDVDEEDGPIDLRKKPCDRTKCSDTPPPERRTDDVSTTSADALLDIWQRTLLSAVQPYLSPLLIATAEAAAKAASGRYGGSEVDSFPQAPIVCDPFGGRHLVVRSQDGNVVAVPLGGAPPLYENAKDLQPGQPVRPLPLRKQNYSEQLLEEHGYRKAPVAHKSELVSRLESAPVLSRSEYQHGSRYRDVYSPMYRDVALREALGHRRHLSDRTVEDAISRGGSSEEDRAEGPRRWAAESVAPSRLYRSRSCSELPTAGAPEERPEDRLSPASRSCPSLTVPSTSGRWQRESEADLQNPRKRKNQFHPEPEEDSEEGEEPGREIINAPITRLFNPKRNQALKQKMPRLIRMESLRETLMEKSSPTHKRYYDPYEDMKSDDGRLTSRMTPEQEETFLERLRHSAPLGVPWNVYSYYNQMMQNLTEPPSGHPGPREPPRSEVPGRTGFASSGGSPSPATTPVPVSPPMASSAAAGSLSQLNPNDARKASRVLTGKHVRQGTGASPSTLMTLRQKIQERQRAKEMSFQSGFGDKKEAKKRNGVQTLNKGR